MAYSHSALIFHTRYSLISILADSYSKPLYTCILLLLQLFMKATHLEQIANDYERAEEHQKLMKEGIQKKKEVRPSLFETK